MTSKVIIKDAYFIYSLFWFKSFQFPLRLLVSPNHLSFGSAEVVLGFFVIFIYLFA